MKKLAKLYRYANLLSLDVALGAVVSSLFFARLFQVQLLPWGYGALGITVWVIYTTDHLLDAKRIRTPASSERHRFHQRHFAPILMLSIAAAVTDLVCISMIRKQVFQAGVALGALTIIYLLIQRNLNSLKEISGALLYCAGVMLPALSLTKLPWTVCHVLLLMEFGITVLCNLLLFSLFDFADDQLDRHVSFVTVVGVEKTRLLLKFLFCVNTLLLMYQLFRFENGGFALVVMAMNLVLFFIFAFPGYFKAGSLYRLAGDAVFFIPAFVLITGNR